MSSFEGAPISELLPVVVPPWRSSRSVSQTCGSPKFECYNVWLNAQILALLEERDAAAQLNENGIQAAVGAKNGELERGEKRVKKLKNLLRRP